MREPTARAVWPVSMRAPQKAIQLKMPEKNPEARYRNEHITLAEIIRANCQDKPHTNHEE